LVVGLNLLSRMIFIVNSGEVVLTELFGQYHRKLQPGIHFLNPFIEHPKWVRWTRTKNSDHTKRSKEVFHSYRIPTQEITFDFPPVEVITSDRLNVVVDGLMFIRIVDHKKAVYEIDNLYTALEELVLTSIRHVLTSLSLDQAIDGQAEIRKAVLNDFRDLEDRWGIELTRFDVQNVAPSKIIVAATELLVKARREAEAQLAQAEAERKVQLLRTQTQHEVEVLKAEGAKKRKEMEAATDLSTAQKDADAKAFTIEKQAEADFKKNKLELDAIAYGIKKEAEAVVQNKALLGESEKKYLTSVLSVKGVAPEYLTQQLYNRAWQALSSSENKHLVIPYDSTKFLGNLSLLPTQQNK